MSNLQRTGYDYIPVPGEPYYPQGKPVEEKETDTVIAQGTDSRLVVTGKGDIVVTDKNGNRRSR